MAQTAPVDICVVDDGSSSPIVIPEFAKGRTQVLRLRQNGGITVALRAGVQFAADRGYEFICRLDVGDLSVPDRVQRQLAHLDEHPGIDLVGAFARVLDRAGAVKFYHGVRGGPWAVKAYLWKNSPFRHSSFFIRTRALIEAGSYDLAFNGAEDYELLLRLAKTGRVDCLSETLIDDVINPTGITEGQRARQLKTRLRAQLRHGAPANPAWYAGVARTLVVMITPRRLAWRITLWNWNHGRVATTPERSR